MVAEEVVEELEEMLRLIDVMRGLQEEEEAVENAEVEVAEVVMMIVSHVSDPLLTRAPGNGDTKTRRDPLTKARSLEKTRKFLSFPQSKT